MYQLLTDEMPRPDADGRVSAPSSVRNASNERGGDPELDIITAKATHLEADRRYASGEALANDIERYLRGRPIQAAPDSIRYRSQKFVRRHLWGVAAMVALMTMTIGFVWKLSNETERARLAEEIAQRESKTASRVVDYLVGLFDGASPEKVGGRAISPVELVDAGVHALSDQLQDQPQPKARLYVAIGEIYAKLGQAERGIATMTEAIRLQREMGDSVRLSKSLQLYGNMLNASGRFAAASEVLLEGIAIQEARDVPDPRAMAEMLTSLSLVSARIGQLQTATSHAESALRFAAMTGKKAPMLRGEANNALSEAYLRNGDMARAIEISRGNVAELEAEPELLTTLLSAREFLAANLTANGELAEAEVILRGVLTERMQRVDPNSDWLIGLRNQLAIVVRNRGKTLEAIELLRTNIEAMKSRGETATPAYAIALNNLGSFNEYVGDIETATPLFREALDLADSDADANSARRDIYRQSLGRMLTLGGNYAEGLRLLEREILDDGSEDRRIARFRRLIHLAEWHRLNAHFESAKNYLAEAQSNLLANFSESHPRAISIMRAQGLLAGEQKQWLEAEAHLRAALSLAEIVVGVDANPTTELRIDLVGVLLRRGERAAAREQLELAQPWVASHFSSRSTVNVQFARYAEQLGLAQKLSAIE
jgi:serine/threonine-protein kinase